MSLKKVNPTELAAPIGFSHGMVVNGGTLIFLAGQTALNKNNEIEGNGIVEQFERVISNLLVVLKEAGGKTENLVKLNIYVVDPVDYRANAKEIGKIWQRLIGRNYPAMTLVGVTKLWDASALLEIEGVAVI
jgi:enamine deaminase RidA (YjgF/YER057c/UK114 family)